MKNYLSVLPIVLVLFTLSCNEVAPKKIVEREIINDTLYKYFSTGELKAVKPLLNLEEDDTKKPSYTTNGVNVYYYKTGIVKARVNHKKGRKQGEVINYHENGEIYSIEHFEGGVLHGVKQKFSTDGILLYEAFYQNGEHVKNTMLFDYKGNKLETPKLLISHEDRRLKEGVVRLKMELKPKKGVTRADYFITVKMSNRESFNFEIPVKKAIGYYEIPVQANVNYIAKVYVVSRCQMNTGDFVGVLGNYNLVTRALF